MKQIKAKLDNDFLQLIMSDLKVVVADVKDDYITASEGKYDNGLPRYVWDKRLNRLSKKIKSVSNLKEIPIDRVIWKTMGIFNYEDGSLYLFTSHKNFDIVQKKIQRGYISHYMYALTSCNPHVSEQLCLDGIEDEQKTNEWRIQEAKKILGDTFEKIKRTYIITYDYFEATAINGTLTLVDDNFTTLDTILIPEYRLPGTDNSKHNFNKRKESLKAQKRNKLVEWNPNKHRKNANIRKDENGTSN